MRLGGLAARGVRRLVCSSYPATQVMLSNLLGAEMVWGAGSAHHFNVEKLKCSTWHRAHTVGTYYMLHPAFSRSLLTPGDMDGILNV